MKASLRSVRIAPKKAQLVAKMIRGKRVPEAVSILEHTNKKGARLLEDLLRSAMANASHNEKQDAQMMIVKSLTVNKAQAYHRGVPMARGRVRPMRKFLSHIEMTLGYEEEATEGTKGAEAKKEEKKSEAKTSKEEKKPVQKKTTAAKKSSTTSTTGKSAKKETATKTSKSSASPKS